MDPSFSHHLSNQQSIAFVAAGVLLLLALKFFLISRPKLVDRSPQMAAHIRILVASASRGDPVAQAELAQRYMNGDGVRKDLKQADLWFRKAAQHGHALGELYLGYREQGSGHASNALSWFVRSARRGNAEAMENVAKYYETGMGVPRDPVLAAQYYKSAADKNRPGAKRLYAQCLLLGHGVEQDIEAGTMEMHDAAELGDKTAQQILELGIESFLRANTKNANDEYAVVENIEEAQPKPLPPLPDLLTIARSAPPPDSTLSQPKQDAEKAEKPVSSLVPRDKRMSMDEVLKALDGLIGLEGVKDAIHGYINRMRMHQLRRKHGLPETPMSVHLVFTGNPGTGKTTVARLLGNVFREIGFLRRGHLVEVSRGDLVGEFVGQTAPLVKKRVEEALDGVLFIDEAYSLLDKDGAGGGASFGAEAVATLLKVMEDNRDRLVVIAAGYGPEMEEFIDSNPGLQSRFTKTIEFEDFTSYELARIFENLAAEFGYVLNPDAATALHALILTALIDKEGHFGNARFVRNAFDETLNCLANRLAQVSAPAKDELVRITRKDIQAAQKNLFGGGEGVKLEKAS